MAKRSDFAQKLLDDLRLRKERMNASQKSSQSKQPPVDAYAYSKQTQRGSRSYKGSESVSSRTGNMPNRASRSHRSTKTGEVSNQIVPYGTVQRLEQSGDMSLALAFPFENGGKIRGTDSFTGSIMSFFSQLKKGTLSFGKMERRGNSGRELASASQFPALSPVQINEIYKGAQKLNQILSASNSNGLTIDRQSIEFAKELLQGAINLEESLRIIVNQQKNSEFIVTPQKKTRIILLEDDDDDGNEDDEKTNTSEQKQLAPPVFSFDKRPKHSQNLQGNQNTSLMQTNYSKGKKLNNGKQDVNTSKLLPHHKRSSSYGSNMKSLNALSEQNNQLASVQSDPDMSMIPNVIAKLMGLDNPPEKVEGKYTQQRDSSSAQKIEGMTFKHTSKGSEKKMELKSRQTENLLPQKKQKVIEASTMPATQHKELGVDKSLNMRKAKSGAVADNGIKSLKSSDTGSIKKNKQNDSTMRVNFIRESRIGVQEKGRRQDHTTNREQKGTVKGRTNDLVLNNMLNQMEQVNRRSEVKSLLQEQKETNGSLHQSEKRHTNMHILANQEMSQNHLGIQESSLVLKYGPREEKHNKEQRPQLSEKQMLKGRSQRGSEPPSSNLSKPPHELFSSQKKQLFVNHVVSLEHNLAENSGAVNSDRSSISYYDNLVRDEVSNGLHMQINEMNKESTQLSSPRDQVKGRQGVLKVMVERSVHKIADKKVKNTKKHKSDMPGKIDEVLTRRNGKILQIPKQIKQQSPIMQQVMQRTSDKFNVSKEAEQERVGSSKEADTCIISSNRPVATTEPSEVRCSQESEALISNYLHQGVKSVTIRDLQDQAALVTADEGLESGQIAPCTMNGMHEDRMSMNSHVQVQGKIFCPKPLTESENRLKWNLIKSQLFLNTAETIFRFDMPYSTPLGSGWDNQDLSSKLMLDCGYEVMKRKGIRQEFKVHPCSKASTSTIRIRSLDDLVRQLNEDIEKLTLYGRSRISQVEIEDYLPKMLENDVYNKDPDIDCMWELGWNDDTFAFIETYEAIRNMEKHLLNGLLDEITRELWHFQGLTMIATNSAE
ncbi:uncharacterized protein LOC114715884 [Neltuma alba]|uniref:uncharacterized protein LOC114715884 n=1 Tax=Neltuma alba TaxID=207710 RepID=UPI0010A58DB2|nr:uncharacterized protein LOC114715884 [Prosopis alba]